MNLICFIQYYHTSTFCENLLFFVTFYIIFIFSGAKIQLERDSDTTLNGLRRVRLSGSTSQIDYAKLLIDEKVEVTKKLKARDELKGFYFLCRFNESGN